MSIATSVLVIILLQTGLLSTRHIYTVEEALAKLNRLNGRTITIRGYSIFTPLQSMQLCNPPRCNCNQSIANGFWLISEDTLAAGLDRGDFLERTFNVTRLDCKGDECSITCNPINPKTDNELELTGRITYDPQSAVYPTLEVENWDKVREEINGEWRLIATGTFTIQLREP